jgi:CRP/FNR family cyclic AMP-dependent transcriptional regulator
MSSRTRSSSAPADLALDTLNLSPALLALAERASPRRYRKGVLLIQEGEIGDTLYIVLSGRVKVFSLGTNDREITFGLYGPGEFVGEMSLDGGPRAASVITTEPTSCAVITRATLLEHIAQYPEFALELLAKVIRRARMATRDARNMALVDSYGRLAVLLDEMTTPQPDGSRCLTDRLTHADIASRIGCSREMVSRLLKDLERGGYIETRAGSLHLLKPLPPRW